MTIDNAPTTDETAEPVDETPRRRRMRWWGWLLTILGAFLGLAVSSWFGWGYAGQKRLDELVAEIRSRGEPLEWKDVAKPPVPDEQNAMVLYTKAGKRLSGPTGKYTEIEVERRMDTADDFLGNPTFRRQQRAEVADLLELARDSLAMLRQGGALVEVDFQTDFSDSFLNWKLPRLPDLMSLASLAALSAIEAHEAGRDAEALASVNDVLKLSRSIGRGPGFLCYLVSTHCDRMAILAMEQMVWQPGRAPVQAAARTQARQVLGYLLEEAPAREAWRQALLIERTSQYEAFGRIRRGSAVFRGERPFRLLGVPAWVTGPLLTWGELHCIEATTSLLEGAKETTYPAALRKMDNGPDSYQALCRLAQKGEGSPAYRVAFILLPIIYVDTHYAHLSLRRLAATALAMRLYEVEKGKPVAGLADLVAAGYLEAIPADPFSDKGELIRYKADPKQPLLYSVGKNGLDDGGAFTLDAGGDVDDDSPDIVFFLHGDRPAGKVRWKPPATAPATRASPATSAPTLNRTKD